LCDFDETVVVGSRSPSSAALLRQRQKRTRFHACGNGLEFGGTLEYCARVRSEPHCLRNASSEHALRLVQGKPSHDGLFLTKCASCSKQGRGYHKKKALFMAIYAMKRAFCYEVFTNMFRHSMEASPICLLHKQKQIGQSRSYTNVPSKPLFHLTPPNFGRVQERQCPWGPP